MTAPSKSCSAHGTFLSIFVATCSAPCFSKVAGAVRTMGTEEPRSCAEEPRPAWAAQRAFPGPGIGVAEECCNGTYVSNFASK